MLGCQGARRRERRSTVAYGLRQTFKTLREWPARVHLDRGIRDEVGRASVAVQRRLRCLPVTPLLLLQEPQHAEIVAQHPHAACGRMAMSGHVVWGRVAITDHREEIELHRRRERGDSLRGLENAKDGV